MKKDYEYHHLDLKQSNAFKNESSNGPKSKRNYRAKCSVSGTMYLMLCVSRLLGLAPVRFETRLANRLVSVSPALCMLNFFVVTVINVGTFVGLVLDMFGPLEESGRFSAGPTRWFVWVASIIMVMAYMGISVYRAPRRLEQVIRCLDQVNKVGIESSHAKKVSEGRKRCAFILIFTTIALALVVADYSNYLIEVQAIGIKKYVIGMYSCQYGGLLIIQIMEMQFIITGWEVQSALTSLNDVLEEVARLVKEQGKNVIVPNSLVNEFSPNPVGHVVDIMVAGKDKNQGFKRTSSSKPHEMIHRLQTKHYQLCGVVRQLNSCFGPELLSVLTSCMVHLVSTPNTMISRINSENINFYALSLEMIWCFWYAFCTIAVVEQGYMTNIQMKRTNWLVSDLVLSSNNSLVQDELKKFAGFLLLNKASYMPMGACSLNRGLVVSILGSVTTYLVIIYQFQQADK